jgi:16S rRNA (guanine527-N7)-methyltransferase
LKSEDVQNKHFLDSLSIFEVLKPILLQSKPNVLDVGTGAGFPGIPLKIAFPHIHLTLIEARKKKAQFLNQVVEELDLKTVRVLADRAETLGHHFNLREQFDVVLARAVAKLDILCELTLPFCNIGGVVVAQKGHRAKQETQDAMSVIKQMGGKLTAIHKISGAHLVGTRTAVIIHKTSITPNNFPRRPGIPKKRLSYKIP